MHTSQHTLSIVPVASVPRGKTGKKHAERTERYLWLETLSRMHILLNPLNSCLNLRLLTWDTATTWKTESNVSP